MHRMVASEKYCETIYEEKSKQPHKKAIRRYKLNYNRIVWFFVGCFICIMAILLSYLGQHAAVVKNNMRNEALLEEKNRLLHEEELIDVKIAKSASYTRVAALAESELGMGEPAKVQFLLAKDKEGKVIFTAKDYPIHKKCGYKSGLMARVRSLLDVMLHPL
ncbi:MAG: hypothetical protein ACM3WV_04620 [Bacillota bacterium]